jgi:hypothetical protein
LTSRVHERPSWGCWGRPIRSHRGTQFR